MRLLDFARWSLLLQMATAVVIASFAGAALICAGRDITRARLVVADGVIGGLGIMTAATLLRTIAIRTWHQLLMFSLILCLLILLKKLFVWEKRRILAESVPRQPQRTLKRRLRSGPG
ncbi:MAG: hypothetical protein L0Z53_12425 [Acidobacteriales bacterium]|nr:hypothetical protein [Terriglobales bacterium]